MLLEVFKGPLVVTLGDDPPVTWETGHMEELSTYAAIQLLYHFGEDLRVRAPNPLVVGSYIWFRNPLSPEIVSGPCPVSAVHDYPKGKIAELRDLTGINEVRTRTIEVLNVQASEVTQIENTHLFLSIIREGLQSWNGIDEAPELFNAIIARLIAAGLLPEGPHA